MWIMWQFFYLQILPKILPIVGAFKACRRSVVNVESTFHGKYRLNMHIIALQKGKKLRECGFLLKIEPYLNMYK